MSAQSRVPDSDPLMVAWKAYQASEDFENTKKWALHPEHVQGSLWATFKAGYRSNKIRAERAEAERDALRNALKNPSREMWAAGGNAVLRDLPKMPIHHDRIIEPIWQAMARIVLTSPDTEG